MKITYDDWHAILATAAVFIFFILFWEAAPLLESPLLKAYPALAFALCYLAAVLCAHHLQCWNESRQSRDPQVDKKYGSWIKFQINSIRDFGHFWRGILVSWVFPVGYILIF